MLSYVSIFLIHNLERKEKSQENFIHCEQLMSVFSHCEKTLIMCKEIKDFGWSEELNLFKFWSICFGISRSSWNVYTSQSRIRVNSSHFIDVFSLRWKEFKLHISPIAITTSFWVKRIKIVNKLMILPSNYVKK